MSDVLDRLSKRRPPSHRASEMEGYRCVTDSRGLIQYRLNGRRVAEAAVPQNVRNVLTCPAPGNVKRSPKTSPNARKSPLKRISPKTSPKRITIGGEKPRSPAGKGAVGRGGLPRCPKTKAYDADFLRFWWEETKASDPTRTRQLIDRFEAEYEQEYPYEREELAKPSRPDYPGGN
jgi:hypothetical protein